MYFKTLISYFLLLIGWCWATATNPSDNEQTQQKVLALTKEIQQLKPDPANWPKYVKLLEDILEVDPNVMWTRFRLAQIYLSSSDASVKKKAFDILMETLHNYPPEVLTAPETGFGPFLVTATLGRELAEQQDYKNAKYFLNAAFEASKNITWEGSSPEGNLCVHLMLASLWNRTPRSIEEADESLKDQNELVSAFLNRKDFDRRDKEMAATMPGFFEDQMRTCLISVFQLSFYYRAETAAVASRHYELAAKVWPEYVWTSPHLQDSDYNPQQCRKTKIAVMSAVLTVGHPVTEDFHGVLQRLDRSKFDVTYIFLEDTPNSLMQLDPFLKANSEDELKIYRFEQRTNDYIVGVGKEIAQSKFDIILHLDLTMSAIQRRLGMMKLAPVQINTHGHPVTSGHPESIVDYFISWAEAELPPIEAQKHYTEKLKLIPMGKIHQYYQPRRLPGEISRVDGAAFGHLTLNDFDLPANKNIYLNMQNPWKLHPEFDPLVCGILKGDPNGIAVLHRANPVTEYSNDNKLPEIFYNRLKQAGCDMNRIHFIPRLPHHRLMALIGLSTVVMDSYPAGGCTTSREVFEMGKAIITLPARLLGGRWTLGLYNILGMSDLPVIAATPQEYIDLAVQLGTNATLRSSVEDVIITKVKTMFYKDEAVEEWEKILLEVSPVQCIHDEL